MADIYRDMHCTACGESHTLYDTSVIRHVPGGLYSFTCPQTGLAAEVRCQKPPEVVGVLPEDALPMDWVRD